MLLEKKCLCFKGSNNHRSPMKKLIRILTFGNPGRFLISMLGAQLFLFTVLLLPGCTTTPPTPEQTAASQSKSIIASVEKTRADWADYVVIQRAHLAGIRDTAGMAALADKETRVKFALEKYQAAATAAVISHSAGDLADAANTYQAVVAAEMK